MTILGTSSNAGSVFKLLPPAGAQANWVFRTMYKFSGGADGANPNPIMIGKNKVIYGTTINGGGACQNCGAVFKVTE